MIQRILRGLGWTLVVALVGGIAALYLLRGRGVSARSEPSAVEARAALFLRSWLTPPEYKRLQNPVALTDEILASGREHFADHCASCHANDGGGDTEMGRGLYPKAPDLRAARTQDLSDGELFYIIENGVRLTGMPGWSTGTPEGETSSWHLVHFIRHLPAITAEEIQEMERLNPKSLADLEREREIQAFLEGGAAAAPAPTPDPHAAHGGKK
jgi:mono/diheme cytochrome c family protein